MSLPEAYERFLVEPLFRPFAEELLNRLNPGPHDSLLDVACGTGLVARLARRRLGPEARLAGVDASPTMLAVARQADSTIDWRDGNSVALPVKADERFTVRGIDGPTFARLNAKAVVGMSQKSRELSDSQRADLTDRVSTDSLDVVDRYTRDRVFRFTISTSMAAARASV